MRKQSDERKTQRTPKGHEIPVPNKDDVMRVLEKAAEPVKPSTPSRRTKK